MQAAFPAIAVASVIPMALFYLTLAAGSIVWAIGVSVVYAYGFAAVQYGRRRRVSGMLLLTVFMVTVGPRRRWRLGSPWCTSLFRRRRRRDSG